VLLDNGTPILQNVSLLLVDLVLDESCFFCSNWLSTFFLGHLLELSPLLLSEFVNFGTYQQYCSFKFVFFKALEESYVGLLK
jgi:hypothetical protein